MLPMPEKRIFPMKNLLHYGSWLITAGVEGSEPTNLVFCRYFERPTQFFYQSSKEWAQGGAADHLHDRELGGCENPLHCQYQLAIPQCFHMADIIPRDIFITFIWNLPAWRNRKIKCASSLRVFLSNSANRQPLWVCDIGFWCWDDDVRRLLKQNLCFTEA